MDLAQGVTVDHRSTVNGDLLRVIKLVRRSYDVKVKASTIRRYCDR